MITWPLGSLLCRTAIRPDPSASGPASTQLLPVVSLFELMCQAAFDPLHAHSFMIAVINSADSSADSAAART